MPENNYTITVDDLPEFERGYVDALITHFTNLDDHQHWVGVGTGHLAPEALSTVVKDCRNFIRALENIDIDAVAEVNATVEDYQFGWQFFLERMELGVGFAELAVEPDMRDKLIDAAQDLKPFDLELGKDGLARIVKPAVTYRSLTGLQRGFAEALVDSQSGSQRDLDWEDFDDSDGGEPESRWYAVTVHDFSRQSLETIVEDCEKFVAAIVGEDRRQWPDLFANCSDHDIGWYLYLERQGSGVGLRDLLPEGDLLDRVLKASEELGEMTVEVGDDGQIHVSNNRGSPAKPAV